MSAAYETQKSRKFRVAADGSNFLLDYIVVGAADEDTAWTAVIAQVPTAYKSLPRSSFDFDPQGGGVWFVKVEYNPRKYTTTQNDAGAPEAGKDPGPKGSGEGGGNPAGDADPTRPIGRQLSFSTAGGTKHITCSLAEMDAKRSNVDGLPANPPDTKAIGWSRTGVVGTDIVAPNGEFVLNLNLIELTLGYFLRLFAMTGSMNDAPWNGFNVGEILFLGADGHWVDADAQSEGHLTNPGHWEISFRFKYSPTRFNVDLGYDIVFAQVLGWDLIDVIYADIPKQLAAGDTVMVQVPRFAYVQRIYPMTDFFDLGISEAIFAPE